MMEKLIVNWILTVEIIAPGFAGLKAKIKAIGCEFQRHEITIDRYNKKYQRTFLERID